MTSAPRFCHLCGSSLGDKVYVYRHPSWDETQALNVCADCHRRAARCVHCGLPLAPEPGGRPGDNRLCPTCAAAAPHCRSCGQPIVRRYVEVNGQGPYCEACCHLGERCDVCGVPLGEARQQLSDGRTICGQCHATAIYDVVAAHTLYQDVVRLIDSHLGLTLNVPTGLTLVGRDQLAAIVRQQQTGPLLNDITRTLGVYARRGIKRGLYLQSGLPQRLFVQVAAHEWGHAWQGENCPLLQDPLVKEGFAEWVAYKILGVMTDEDGMQRLVARTDIYGDGLRAALRAEAGGGVAGVVAWCRSAR